MTIQTLQTTKEATIQEIAKNYQEIARELSKLKDIQDALKADMRNALGIEDAFKTTLEDGTIVSITNKLTNRSKFDIKSAVKAGVISKEQQEEFTSVTSSPSLRISYK
jgi:prophage DNA circulation protein